MLDNIVHFIGIGGVGMSGIARVAKDQGMQVSGSDMKKSRCTRALEEAGIHVCIGHSPKNIPEGNPTVVVSTAILDNNVELQEARRRGLQIVHRAEMLAYLGRNLKTLAVAGTHGKTTTSSMLASVLDACGLSPTFLIGGTVRAYGTNAHSGSGEYYVIEADESDKSFTFLNPSAAIITNIEPDHLDHYSNLDEIYELFGQFIASVPSGGPIVVCAEDERAVALARKCAATPESVISYGLDDEADVRIINPTPTGLGYEFSLRFPNGLEVTSQIKQNPGIHNVLNGAAVLTLVYALGLDVKAAAQALREFAGVRRRFDLVGKAADITVVDDYAHHPTEIASTINGARALGFNHIHVLFQPHRYSRVGLFTEVLKDEFARAFDSADTVTFMDVYSAGETPVPGVNGQTFLDVVTQGGHPSTRYISRRIDVASAMADVASAGDLIMTMGAGDVTEIGPLILDELRARGSVDKLGKRGASSASERK